MPSLQQTVRSTKIAESLTNYALSDKGIDGKSISDKTEIIEGLQASHIGQEWQFWNPLLEDSTYFKDRLIKIDNAVVSEWVARVPGLFYKRQ